MDGFILGGYSEAKLHGTIPGQSPHGDRMKCKHCGAEMYWEGHPFLKFWKCPNECEQYLQPEEYVQKCQKNKNSD